MPYPELLTQLESAQDVKYRDFHKRLLKNENIKVIGVRVPVLRKIAKDYLNRIDELMSYPDEYYEVTFVKLTAVSYLKYEAFIKYVEECVRLIDNWATCDCFCAKCIAKNRQAFLPYIAKFSDADKEFYQRFALVTLLHYYVEEDYAELIFDTVLKCNTNYYYVHMAAAWLVAEMLVKCYGTALKFIKLNLLDRATHNKSIQKACESYRLSDEIKNFLKGLKR